MWEQRREGPPSIELQTRNDLAPKPQRDNPPLPVVDPYPVDAYTSPPKPGPPAHPPKSRETEENARSFPDKSEEIPPPKNRHYTGTEESPLRD